MNYADMYYGSLITEMLLQGYISDMDGVFQSDPSLLYPDTSPWDENLWDYILARASYCLIRGKYDELENLSLPFPISKENYVHLTLVELIKIFGLIRKGKYSEAEIRLQHVTGLMETCPPETYEKLTIIQYTIKSFLVLEEGKVETAFDLIQQTTQKLDSIDDEFVLISRNFEKYWFAYLKNNRGLAKIYLGKFEEAEKDFEEVLEVLDQFDYAQIKFFAWMNLAYSCQIIGDYSKAIFNLEKAAEAISYLGNEGDLPYILRELGKANFELGNIEQAQVFYERAYEQAKEYGSPKNILERASDLHGFLCSQRNLEEATKLFNEISEYYDSLPDAEILDHIFVLIKCRQSIHFDRLPKILEIKDEMLDMLLQGKFTDILQRLEARNAIISIQLMEYRVSTSVQDLDEMIELVKGLIEEAKGSKLHEIHLQGQILLLNLFLEQGDIKEAHKLIQKIEDLKEECSSLRIERLIDEEISKFKEFLLQREKEITSLNRDQPTLMSSMLEEYFQKVSEIVKKFS